MSTNLPKQIRKATGAIGVYTRCVICCVPRQERLSSPQLSSTKGILYVPHCSLCTLEMISRFWYVLPMWYVVLKSIYLKNDMFFREEIKYVLDT